jgi:hypothetical protein
MAAPSLSSTVYLGNSNVTVTTAYQDITIKTGDGFILLFSPSLYLAES